MHVIGHSDDNGNDRARALVQWGKESGPYARGYEGGGEGESRLRGDGTEGAKAIEDQRKAKAAREAERESETTRSRVDCGSSLPGRSSGLKLICN